MCSTVIQHQTLCNSSQSSDSLSMKIIVSTVPFFFISIKCTPGCEVRPFVALVWPLTSVKTIRATEGISPAFKLLLQLSHALVANHQLWKEKKTWLTHVRSGELTFTHTLQIMCSTVVKIDYIFTWRDSENTRPKSCHSMAFGPRWSRRSGRGFDHCQWTEKSQLRTKSQGLNNPRILSSVFVFFLESISPPKRPICFSFFRSRSFSSVYLSVSLWANERSTADWWKHDVVLMYVT